MTPVPLGQILGDPVQPLVEQRRGPGVQRREGADHPRLALGQHQVGIGDDEQRRADGRQAQTLAQMWRQGHGIPG